MFTICLDPPKTFSSVAKEWPLWKAHFERFHNASGRAKSKDKEQIDTLIYDIGMKAEEISKSIVYSKSGDEKIYDQTLAKFDTHFIPRNNVIYKRYLFHTRSQRKGESAEEFVSSSLLSQKL